MPGAAPSGTAASFGLFVSGVNLTRRSPVENVRISETAGESNSILEFDAEYAAIIAGSGTAPATTSWLTGLGQEVRLEDLTNARRLFKGTLVNARRRHFGATGTKIHCTVISDDSWLDRRILPSWTSKRPNGTNMNTDREQVQNVSTLASGGRWDAINAHISSTNAAMPVVKLPQGGTARSILAAIAEAAATAADPTARRFYIDFDGHLRYFKGNESLTAPYRIGDASYTTVVKATSGLVELWALRESGAPTAYGALGYAHMTRSGANGYTANQASLLPNEPGMRATLFNGTPGFATATGANLHPGDTFSVELWFKRSVLGTLQTMVSAGANDYEIGFTAANEIYVAKEGVGNNFVTTATYTDALPHHLVVTRTPGTTTVYVDGVSKAGTVTARTFVAAAGAVNLARRVSGTDRYFTGTLQDVAIYNTTLSAATALAHYRDGWTIVADEFEFETDINDAGFQVYVRGSTASGSGWVSASPFTTPYAQQFMIDRSQSTNASLKAAIGKAFMAREGATIHGFRAVITMAASTWRAGQTVTIDNSSLGIPDPDGPYTIPATFEIKQLDTYPEMGSGVVTYEIHGGAMPWSGTFAVQRKRKR